MISLFLNINPYPKGRPRFSVGKLDGVLRVRTASKTRLFENQVALALKIQNRFKPLDGALQVRLKFYVKTPVRKNKNRPHPSCRPDLDNLIKGVTDAANKILWNDDGQIVKIEAAKVYDWATRRVGIEIQVGEYTGD